MANLSPHHLGAGVGPRRPLTEDVLRHVETERAAHGHWEWSPLGTERCLNRWGHAVWRTKVVSWLPRQTFTVARLLLDVYRGPFPLRSAFENTCGLDSCVNPHHWRRLLPPAKVRLQRQADGWVPIVARTGVPLTKTTPLIVHIGNDVTHVLVAHPHPANTFRMLCGLEVYPTNLVVHPQGDIVTCTKGCT